MIYVSGICIGSKEEYDEKNFVLYPYSFIYWILLMNNNRSSNRYVNSILGMNILFIEQYHA